MQDDDTQSTFTVLDDVCMVMPQFRYVSHNQAFYDLRLCVVSTGVCSGARVRTDCLHSRDGCVKSRVSQCQLFTHSTPSMAATVDLTVADSIRYVQLCLMALLRLE